MQVPAPTKVMVAPLAPPEVHTKGVVVVKRTANPDARGEGRQRVERGELRECSRVTP